jgi:hypothetical protein
MQSPDTADDRMTDIVAALAHLRSFLQVEIHKCLVQHLAHYALNVVNP